MAQSLLGIWRGNAARELARMFRAARNGFAAMIDSIKAMITASPFAAIAVSFLTGVLLGALFGRPIKADIPAEGDLYDGEQASDPERIGDLRAELEAARLLLDAGDEHDGDIHSEISNLDQAVNRANGRLKLLVRSIRNAKDKD